MRLRILVVDGAVHKLARYPLCQLGIVVASDMHDAINPGFDYMTVEGMRNRLALTSNLALSVDEYHPSRGAENGVFGAMPKLEVLTLCWPE